MKFSLFSVLFTLSVAQWVEDRAAIIIALKNYYRTGCVFLTALEGAADVKQSMDMVHMYKILADNGCPSAMLDASHLTDIAPAFICEHNKALYTLLTSGIDSRYYIQQTFSMLHPSSSIWLLFLRNSSRDSIDSFFEAVDIPFDCEFVVAIFHGQLIELWEVFKVSRNHPLEVSFWGIWSENHGLQYPSVSLYHRRNNLRGLVFAAFGINYPPFTVIDETFQPRGFVPEIIKELSKTLNFSYMMHVVEDFGVKENGSWSGAVGMLINGTLNFSLNIIQITVPRCQDIDFTIPIVNTRYTIYIRTPYSSDTSWSTYLSPYRSTVWITIAVVIISCATLLAFMQRLTQRYPHYNLSEGLLCFWGSFWAQGHYRTPQQWSGRWIHWASFVTGVFILALYSANFVSFLTVPKIVLPFRNMRGILEDTTYSFGILRHVSLFQTFKESNDEVMSRLFSETLLPKRRSLPTSVLLGFNRVCKEKFAFMTLYYDAIALQENILCDLIELPEDSLPISLAIALPKRCPYKGIINFMLQQLRQSGAQHRRLEKWFNGRPHKSTHLLRSVHIYDVLTLFYVCVGGVMISATIFIVELCISWTIGYFRLHRPVSSDSNDKFTYEISNRQD